MLLLHRYVRHLPEIRIAFRLGAHIGRIAPIRLRELVQAIRALRVLPAPRAHHDELIRSHLLVVLVLFVQRNVTHLVFVLFHGRTVVEGLRARLGRMRTLLQI